MNKKIFKNNEDIRKMNDNLNNKLMPNAKIIIFKLFHKIENIHVSII